MKNNSCTICLGSVHVRLIDEERLTLICSQCKSEHLLPRHPKKFSVDPNLKLDNTSLGKIMLTNWIDYVKEVRSKGTTKPKAEIPSVMCQTKQELTEMLVWHSNRGNRWMSNIQEPVFKILNQFSSIADFPVKITTENPFNIFSCKGITVKLDRITVSYDKFKQKYFTKEEISEEFIRNYKVGSIDSKFSINQDVFFENSTVKYCKILDKKISTRYRKIEFHYLCEFIKNRAKIEKWKSESAITEEINKGNTLKGILILD